MANCNNEINNLKVYVVTKTAICHSDPDDSIFEIIGVFKNRSDAKKALDKDELKEREEFEDYDDSYVTDMPEFEYEIKPMKLK